MDNTTNIFKQAVEFLAPFVSFIILLLGYIWSRQIKDFREWHIKHNKDIKELQEERDHDRRYVNEEIKEMNQQMFGREITYNDRLNETREDVRGIKSDIENMKVICNVRHNR